MKNIINSIKEFFNTEKGKWAIYFAASTAAAVAATLIAHKIINKPKSSDLTKDQ